MTGLDRRVKRTGLLALAALAALLAQAPPAAQARNAPCDEQPLARVFLPWADPGWYASVADGGLEAGGAGWTLRGAAAVVAGNEPFYVGSASDSHSLALAPSASATTPPACMGPGHPTLRFFVRSEQALNTTLSVSVEFVDPAGIPRSLPIGTIPATTAWRPSPILPIGPNILALVGGRGAAFTFTPRGGGGWSIDDVYVDPYGKG